MRRLEGIVVLRLVQSLRHSDEKAEAHSGAELARNHPVGEWPFEGSLK